MSFKKEEGGCICSLFREYKFPVYDPNYVTYRHLTQLTSCVGKACLINLSYV